MESETMDMQTLDSESATRSAASPQLAEVELREVLAGEEMTAFRTLNEEWITKFFVLEAKDREVLGDPEGTILRKGGHLYFACRDGACVGCVALIPMGDGVFELSKMAVSPRVQGLGIGRRLLEYVVAQARALGASGLFLGSSTKLKNAVHLYEAVGFKHVPADKLPLLAYTRADVFMELRF